MNFPFGIANEADIYYNSSMFSINKNKSIAEPQISQFIDGMIEEGILTFSYDEVVSYIDILVSILINKHKKDFPSQGWDNADEDSVGWFLIMLATAVNRLTNGAIDTERLFKDVFIKHFENL